MTLIDESLDDRLAHVSPGYRRLLANVETAAAMLGVGRTTVFGLIRDGQLPAIKIGRSTRIPVDALEAWVREQIAQPEASEAA